MGLSSFFSRWLKPAGAGEGKPEIGAVDRPAWDDLSKLESTQHMFKWLADEPYAFIRSNIEGLLREQVADSRLVVLRATSDPHWLSGGRKMEEDDTKMVLMRAGVAFEFDLTVEAQGKTHRLTGVYTWVCVHLDEPAKRQQRVWLDISGTLAQFGTDGELKTRIYFERAG